MKVTIEIDCDTINEILNHLAVIREQIRKEEKKYNLNPFEDEFPKRIRLEDDNCYGSHVVKIKKSVSNLS